MALNWIGDKYPNFNRCFHNMCFGVLNFISLIMVLFDFITHTCYWYHFEALYMLFALTVSYINFLELHSVM